MSERQEIKVVLIEDHDLTRVGLRTALQAKSNISVVGESGNAIQGLRLLEIHQPDVAIVDIGLPDMDGIELTRKYRERNSDPDYPLAKILILTMHDSEDSVLAAFAAGADSYCMKDVNIDTLVEAIQATHVGNAWIDPAIANVVLRQFQEQSASALEKEPEGHTVQIAAVDPEYEQVLKTYPLTERELEILELIVAGCSNAEIAERLYITIGTVKTHVRNVLNKLCANDRTQAAVRALRAGLVA
jgi:DNA-binding NarL/FixJ family response regulator